MHIKPDEVGILKSKILRKKEERNQDVFDQNKRKDSRKKKEHAFD